MIVDTSVLAAILLDEPDAPVFETLLIEAEPPPRISTASVIELLTVVRRRKGAAGVEQAEALIDVLGLRIEPVEALHVPWARDGFGRFGKGAGAGRHGLNYGDCFAYALAKATGLPLLYKGQDFDRTDVDRVL